MDGNECTEQQAAMCSVKSIGVMYSGTAPAPSNTVLGVSTSLLRSSASGRTFELKTLVANNSHEA